MNTRKNVYNTGRVENIEILFQLKTEYSEEIEKIAKTTLKRL